MTDLERAFEILGVAPTDDAAVLRKAWRALVRSYHPDTARTDPEGANKRLTEINVAFDAVSSCKPGEIAKLKAGIAKRQLMAERMRREALQREKEVRAKRQAEQEKACRSASERVEREPRQEKVRARKAEAAKPSRAARTTAVRQQSAGERDIALLVARAEQGFLDAVKACSLRGLVPTQSSYA